MKQLAAGACASEDKALPLQVQNVPQASLDQKLLLLAGQNALPSMYAAGNAPATTKTLVKGGDVVNFQAELAKLGVASDVEPACTAPELDNGH
jgi:raffinose/stachyose/melibiose transport system substrate-binding protein